MFKKTKNKLLYVLILPLTLALFLAVITLSIVVTNINNKKYDESIDNNVNINVNNFDLNNSFLSKYGNAFMQKEEITIYLTGSYVNSYLVRNVLNDWANHTSYIIGSYIYSTTFDIEPLASYQVSGLPSNLEFLSMNSVKTLLESDNEYSFIIRNSNIPTSYNFIKYQPSYGICSLVSKITKDNEVIGILVNDFDTEKFYQNVFPFSQNNNPQVSYFSIGKNGTYLSTSSEEAIDVTSINKDKQRIKSFVYAYKYAMDDGIDIVLVMNTKNAFNTSLYTILGISGIAIAIFVMTLLVSNYISNSIFKPLDRLNFLIHSTLE